MIIVKRSHFHCHHNILVTAKFGLIANMNIDFLFTHLLKYLPGQHHQSDNCRSTTADRTQTVTTGQVTFSTKGCSILSRLKLLYTEKYRNSIYPLSKRHLKEPLSATRMIARQGTPTGEPTMVTTSL